jgi:hypothetical protein
MSSIQLITGVTAGLQTQYGSSSIANAALGVTVPGFYLTKLGMPKVLPPGYISADLVFDFTGEQEAVLALQFRFGDGPQVSTPTGWDSLVVGEYHVEMTQGVDVEGFYKTKVGMPRVLPPGYEDSDLFFDFTEEQEAILALQFRFGGEASLAAPTGWDSLVIGDYHVEMTQGLQVFGFHKTKVGMPRVLPPGYEDSDLFFDFTEEQEAVLALQFRFGDSSGASLLFPSSIPPVEIGVPSVENAADALYPSSIPPSSLGLPTVTPYPYGLQGVETPGSNILFDFTVVKEAVLPWQAAFGSNGTKQFILQGLNSFGAGTPHLEIEGFMFIYPVGWHSLRFGEITQTVSILRPQGKHSLLFGATSIRRDGEIQVSGLDSFATGTAFVEMDGTIYVHGLDATRWGLIHFEYIPIEDQHVAPMGIPGASFGTSAEVSNWWRLIWMPDATRKTAYGTPFVDFRIRYVDVFQGINSLTPGAFQVGFHRDITAIGRDHSEFGTAEIMVKTVRPDGWLSFEAGPNPRVTYAKQFIGPRGYRPFDSGEPYVWNLTQIVGHRNFCPELGYYCGAEWGQTHHFFVLNRNRHIYPYGTVMTRFEFRAALVLNAGRALLMRSKDPENFGPWYERHMISHYVRYLPVPGLDSFRIVTHHKIHNAAQAIYPTGIDATQFGSFDKILWRWLRQNGLRHDESGIPWVSFSPRYVQIYSNRSSSRFSHPFVAFGQRPLAPESIPPSYIPWPYLTQKPVPRITPRWQRNEYQFGQPSVKNVTPQLFVFGKRMFESIPQYNWVSHSPRYPSPEGWQVGRYGKPDVVFRNRTIYMGTHVSSRVPQHFRVENKDPTPVLPGPQFVYMSNVCRYAGPGQGNCSGTGRPTVHANSLRPSGFSSLFVGAPSFIHNAVRFRSWHSNPLGYTAFGTPSLNRPESVHFGPFTSESWGEERGEHYGRAPTSQPPKFRVSPHTIWARLDAPQQALINHNNTKFCEVDKFCAEPGHPFGGNHTGPWFGSIRVRPEPGSEEDTVIVCGQSFNQNTWSCHRMFMRMGEPSLENKKRVLEMDGWLSPLFGFPRLTTPFTRTVRVWGSANDDASYGNAFVWDNGPRYATNVTLGLVFKAGTTHIENFHREIYPVGLNATQWGNNNPMVHFPRRLTPYNNVLTQYGTTWVSHSPRWVLMMGADHFISIWTVHALRMQVRNRNGRIRGYGFSIMTEWGEASLYQAEPIVSPYGIAAPCVSPHVTVDYA